MIVLKGIISETGINLLKLSEDKNQLLISQNLKRSEISLPVENVNVKNNASLTFLFSLEFGYNLPIKQRPSCTFSSIRKH